MISGQDHTKESAFSEALHKSIVDGLTSILGENGLKSTYFHLQLEQVEPDPAEFHKRLNSMYSVGTHALEKLILDRLIRETNVPMDNESARSFPDCVEMTRKLFYRRYVREFGD